MYERCGDLGKQEDSEYRNLSAFMFSSILKYC